jgi:hypothetical protein
MALISKCSPATPEERIRREAARLSSLISQSMKRLRLLAKRTGEAEVKEALGEEDAAELDRLYAAAAATVQAVTGQDEPALYAEKPAAEQAPGA